MSEIVLPPLTPKELAERDRQESLLHAGLNECWRGECFDAERAEKFVRAYAVEIFDTILSFYRAKVGYCAGWLPKIVHEAAFRTLVAYKDHSDQGISQIGNIATDTVTEHLDTTSTSERARAEFNAAFPARRYIPEPQPDDNSLLETVRAEPTTQKEPTLPSRITAPRSLGDELKRLLVEARIRPEDIAEEIGIGPRNVYRHLAENTVPSISNLGRYEKVLSKHLGRPVKLPTSVKRQNVSKTS